MKPLLILAVISLAACTPLRSEAEAIRDGERWCTILANGAEDVDIKKCGCARYAADVWGMMVGADENDRAMLTRILNVDTGNEEKAVAVITPKRIRWTPDQLANVERSVRRQCGMALVLK